MRNDTQTDASMIWCAEIGSNHCGSKATAFELIRQAENAGATIAKFQLGWDGYAQERYTADHKYDPRRDIDAWVEDLSKFCDHIGIEFMASIWSMHGLHVARSVGMKRYKIAHQLEDEELTSAIIRDGKEVFQSSLTIPHTPVKGIRKILTSKHYPTYPPVYISDFPLGGYGYSSHMHGIADALIAVARGAEYIEKHLTLDRTQDWPRDHLFSLLPSEFKNMVEIGNEIARLR